MFIVSVHAIGFVFDRCLDTIAVCQKGYGNGLKIIYLSIYIVCVCFIFL